jgi:hypothetical protein
MPVKMHSCLKIVTILFLHFERFKKY